MNSFSWFDVSKRLEAFANGHFQIMRFGVGEIGDIDKEAGNDATYPLMFAVHPTVTAVPGALNYSMEIVFCDLSRDFEDKTRNQVQVISDLVRIALDLVSEIKKGEILFGDEVELVGNTATIETGAQQYNNVLCVARVTFQLVIPFQWNACEIPADYAPAGSGQLPGGGYPDWCDKLQYCPIIIQIQSDLDDKLETVSVDGITITGDGTPSDPLVAVGGGGGGSGTVTSVDVAVDGDAITPTGGPVTTAGTITLGFNGESTDYINGEGNLVAFPTLPTGTVESVTGVSTSMVDNTDPDNPIVNAIPLSGTDTGFPVTGNTEYSFENNLFYETEFFKEYLEFGDGAIRLIFIDKDTGYMSTFAVQGNSFFISSDNPAFGGVTYAQDFSGNEALETLIPQITLKKRFWTKAGTPTTSDDDQEGFIIGSLIWDTTNSILYRATSVTTGAAAWTVAIAGGGSGTVNSGTANRLTYYAATGTAVSELAAITASRALKSDANGLPVAFDTATEPTLTELSYVKGVTSAIQTQINGRSSQLDIHSDISANFTYTNQPNSEQNIAQGNTIRGVLRFDATTYTEIRLVISIAVLSASANDPRAYPQYNNGGGWTTIGAGTVGSGDAVSFAATGGQFSNWITLPAGALGDVWFRVAANGGDGAADPAFGNISLQIR